MFGDHLGGLYLAHILQPSGPSLLAHGVLSLSSHLGLNLAHPADRLVSAVECLVIPDSVLEFAIEITLHV